MDAPLTETKQELSMSTRFFRILSILLVVAFLLSACGTAKAEPKTPLRVGWSLWPGYYPMAIAAEKGFFEKHGVQVEPVFYNIYSNQTPDLASGMVDGALLSLSDIMFDSISSDVKAVLVLDNSAGAEQIVVSSDIADIQGLRGKRIGYSPLLVGSQLLIHQMLKNNGVALSEVTLVNIPPEKVPGAIPDLIDAGYTYDPYTTQALAKGSKIFFTSADTPGLIVDVLAMRKEITRDRPEDVKAFIAAWLEAVQYWKDNPADGNAIIAKATGLKTEEISPEGVTLFDLDANIKTFKPGAATDLVYAAAQQQVKFLIENGDMTRNLNINDLLDPSFLR
jgi:NitT/TauT family transport system substrate-binding protein